MSNSVLTKYLRPEVLSMMADRQFDPQGLVIGDLAGSHKSPLSGFAVEFAGHREYAPGDDPRHVDWRVYYSRDKYFVKQYELETNFVCHLVVDVSASMRYGEDDQQKLTYASQMAASLGYSIVKQSDKVSLSLIDTTVRAHVAPSNSLQQMVRLTRQFDAADPAEKTDMGACLTELANRTGRREIVMVFSDFFTDLAGIEEGLHRLRYNKHEVVLFHVLHHHEATFDFEGMIKFKGLESADEILAPTDDLRQSYLKAMREYTEQLRNLALQNGCEYAPVDTSRPIADVLIDYLNQRAALANAR